MRFSTLAGALLAAVPAFVSAQTPSGSAAPATATVMVGMNGTLTFNPSSMNLAQGSTVQFVFTSKNHSVVQSSFAQPCAPIAGGFQAQYFPISADVTSFPTVTLQVNQTAPIWFYCPQTNPANHCQKGMVGAINPTADKTFAAFQAAAMGAAAPASSGTPSGSSVAVAPPAATDNANGTAPAAGTAGGKGNDAARVSSGLAVVLSLVLGAVVSTL